MDKRQKTYYVGHILTRPVRRAVMVTLWVAFFIICPSIILYTAGYRYDFKTHQIKQTGVLSVDVEPRDVTVMLNNIQIEKQIPIRLANRAPGTYALKIERPGYKTWERDIVIESNNTTYIKGIILIKDALPIRILDSTENIVSVHGHNDTLLILKKINEFYELHALNTLNNVDTLIYRTPNTEMPIIEVSPYTPLAYSRLHSRDRDTLYLISLTNPENTTITSINKKTKLTWNAISTAEPLYKQENNQISILSATRPERQITAVSSSVWYRDEQGDIWEAEGSTIQNTKNRTTYSLPDAVDSIIHINNSRIIAIHADKTMVVELNNGNTESIQTINGTTAYYNRRTQEWLVWSEWELSSIYPDGGVSLLNRSGEKIQNVSLLDANGVILLATEKELSAFNPGYYVRHHLVAADTYTFISANTTRRTLYFFGRFAERPGIYSLDY